MEFTVAAASGESVTVQSENWMMALGKAMAFFQMDASNMVRWVCTPGAHGHVRIDDPVTGHSWMVAPVEPVVKVVANSPTDPTDEDMVCAEDPIDAVDDPMDAPPPPPPPLAMPSRSQLRPATPVPVQREAVDQVVFSTESLAERLFELSMDISGAEPAEAARRSLAVILEFVPCEAASIARASVAEFGLVYIAATGPVADQIIGCTVPFGQGLVGLCYEAGIPVQVSPVANDQRHHRAFDDEFGFRTRDVLCVPVSDHDNTYGVVQLINPIGSFDARHVEAAQTIARTLAAALAESVG